jgi:hypothetical protein
MATTGILPGWLFLKYQWRPADLVALEGDIYLDTVGDLDEGNAAIHPEFLTVEGHCPFNSALTRSLASKCEAQRLRLGHSANGKGPQHVKGVGTGLGNFG